MEEVIKLFNDHAVRYVLIGGQAVRLEGMPRFSMDWDFYIPPRDTQNINKINEILGEYLDLKLEPLGNRGENFIQTYQTPWGVIQFHLLVAGLPEFAQVEKRAIMIETENAVPVRTACLDDLIASKQKAGRPQDKADIEFLKCKRGQTRHENPDR